MPVRFSVPPLKLTVPAPLNGPLTGYVPLGKLRAPLAPAVNVPEQVDPQVPPPVNEKVPLLPRTVPVLLKLMPMVVVAVPAVFSNVPALFTETAVPPPKTIVLSLA